jgi:hypothetical protein
MKKLLAAFLTITIPIWYIPFAICAIIGIGLYEAYENILKLLEKAQEK